jgi:deoxyribodipyrimidine photo-lyase
MNHALRLSDNLALSKASQFNDPIVPMVVFPEHFWQMRQFTYSSMGPHRRLFITQLLMGLAEDITKRGGQLWASAATSSVALDQVLGFLRIHRVIMTQGVGYYEQFLAGEIKQWCDAHGVGFDLVWDHTLLYPSQLPFSIHAVPDTFSNFRKKVDHCFICPPMKYSIKFSSLSPPKHVAEVFNGSTKQSILNVNEAMATDYLNEYIWKSQSILHYKDTRNLSIGDMVSTKLSCWLSTGCLSPRTVAAEVKKFEAEVEKNDSTNWVIVELLWRDFFQFQCQKHGRNWYRFGGIQCKKDAVPEYNESIFNLWATGNTPEPFVNAHMKELRLTGYMSNRGRQVVASYLIHNLNQDWRRGAEVFEHFLIDYDVASNGGNWMYIAGCGNSATKRVFNIEMQQKKYDPGGVFVAHWLS